MTPSKYYNTLPAVNDTALRSVPSGIHADGDLDTHYSVYVYARQQGNWIDLIYAEGIIKIEEFLTARVD